MPPKRPALSSSIASKTVMALTGLGLLGFVIVHMLGNLQIFAGPDKLNAYAKTLQDLGPLLWVMRAGVAALFLVHILSAFAIVRANRAARPVAYVGRKDQVTTYAASTMIYSGLIVLAFVVFHLLHLTLGVTHPAHYASRTPTGGHDVYAMVVLGFQQAPVALAYVVAQAVLCLHLSHGASSAFQTLGVTHPRLAFLKAGFGKAVAAVIFVGNVSIPLSVLAGLVKLPAGAQ